MTYNYDLRERVINYYKTHTRKKTAKVFNISEKTISIWNKLY